MDLADIQPDVMNGQVMKFAKSIHQLEKGLPPNFLVPKLKKKVEEMREKMPVIQDLCNPSFKHRHWSLIENVLSHTFEPDSPKTLQMLVDLKAFDFSEELQEVSGQASSEASLEGILKKVRCIRGVHVQYMYVVMYTCTCTCIFLVYIHHEGL